MHPLTNCKGAVNRTVIDDNDFDVREKASSELERLGQIAQPALRKAAGSPSAEVRRRVEELLEKGGQQDRLSAHELRYLRALETLHFLKRPETAAVVRKLAEGNPGIVAHEAERLLRQLPGAKP